MKDLAKSRASRVFLLLIAATLFSWHVGHSRIFQDRRALGALIVIIAFLKARWVMLDFMELRHGPRYMRVTAESWLIGVCTLLVAMLSTTGPLDNG